MRLAVLGSFLMSVACVAAPVPPPLPLPVPALATTVSPSIAPVAPEALPAAPETIEVPALNPFAEGQPLPPLVTEPADLPSPGPGWKPAELERARGYVSVYFGVWQRPEDPGALRPVAAWTKGERGEIRIYRRVDPESGAPQVARPMSPDVPRGEAIGPGVSWYGLPSDGSQFYWVTVGSLVMEGRDRFSRAGAIAAVFRPFARRVAALPR